MHAWFQERGIASELVVLESCWRDGALFGETPSDSYYVKFPPLFNRPEDQKAGKLVVEVGLRISYPAEFIVVRIGIWAGGSEVSEG